MLTNVKSKRNKFRTYGHHLLLLLSQHLSTKACFEFPGLQCWSQHDCTTEVDPSLLWYKVGIDLPGTNKVFNFFFLKKKHKHSLICSIEMHPQHYSYSTFCAKISGLSSCPKKVWRSVLHCYALYLTWCSGTKNTLNTCCNWFFSLSTSCNVACINSCYWHHIQIAYFIISKSKSLHN